MIIFSSILCIALYRIWKPVNRDETSRPLTVWLLHILYLKYVVFLTMGNFRFQRVTKSQWPVWFNGLPNNTAWIFSTLYWLFCDLLVRALLPVFFLICSRTHFITWSQVYLLLYFQGQIFSMCPVCNKWLLRIWQSVFYVYFCL